MASWFKVANVKQVVVVDWSSQPPLRPILETVLNAMNNTSQAQLKIVRVEGETEWVLTRAYNLGVREVEVDYVFKVDCDYIVKENALERHRLDYAEGDNGESVFFTGYYMNARDANEMHLNGAMVVSRRVFWSVGGYDERIQSYGYDDEDLYARLSKAGLTRMNVSYEDLSHLEHGDEERAQRHIRFPRVQIDMNRLLLEKIGEEWRRELKGSQYERVKGSTYAVRVVYKPLSIEELVDERERLDTWKLALGRRLRDDYRVPWEIIGIMKTEEAEKLLEGLNNRKIETGVDEVQDRGLRVRFLIVHVQNGLGNRLRALASGLAFARKTEREVIVVWEKDLHFRAFYGDIFNQSLTGFAVLDEFQLKWPLKEYAQYDEAWNDIAYYNYMQKGETGREVVEDKRKNIYFKSSAIMNTELTSWETENEELKLLKVHGYITAMASNVARSGFDHTGGVHIRNRSLDEDIVGAKNNRELYAKEDRDLIDKWRAVTKYTSFVEEMKRLLSDESVNKFFVASDTVGVLYKMKELFSGGQIMFINRACDDRSGKCEQFAMADLLVLSRTKVLLGSTWSSFTEAAMRLGGPKALLAGKLNCEFGSLLSQLTLLGAADALRF